MSTTNQTTMTSVLFWVFPVIAALLLLAVWQLDNNQSLFLQLNALGATFNPALWTNITLLGDALVIIVLALLFCRKKPQIMWSIIITCFIAGFLIKGLKFSFGVPRPPAVLQLDDFYLLGKALYSGSFPSGHTAAAFAFAGLLFLQLSNVMLRTSILILALLIGLSRIMIGVHWPADVLAGALIGWSCAWAGVYLSRWRDLGSNHYLQQALIIIFALAAVFLLFKHDTGFSDVWILQSLIATGGLAIACYELMRRRQLK